MKIKYHPVSRPSCMPALAIGCTTLCESTPPDRRHGSTTVKYRAYIRTKTHISSDIVVTMCVYKQSMWCVFDTIFRLVQMALCTSPCIVNRLPDILQFVLPLRPLRMFSAVASYDATRSLLLRVSNINLQTLKSGKSGMFPWHDSRFYVCVSWLYKQNH